MSHNKVHSIGKVPFSWENAPGESKVSERECPKELGQVGQMTHKLPPPPCPSDSPSFVRHDDLQVPLPPCPFQPSLRCSSKRGLKTKDPFLAAYMECTKSVGHGEYLSKGKHKGDVVTRLRKSMFWLSCKNSCVVREDGLVRLIHSPQAPIRDFRRR